MVQLGTTTVKAAVKAENTQFEKKKRTVILMKAKAKAKETAANRATKRRVSIG